VSLPPSPVEFSSPPRHFYKFSHSWLLGGCHHSCLLQPACLFTVPWGIAPPPLQHSGHPILFALFCCCLLFSFSFFPGWGQCVQDAILIWPRVVCGSTACHLAQLVVVSSQAIWALASGGVEALLVSPFNVEWECYTQAGGVGGSKFCLFLVVFPVRCISSISPRFYFRKHAFCFLPLVAILESSTHAFSWRALQTSGWSARVLSQYLNCASGKF
jgi:hypothetical protein